MIRVSKAYDRSVWRPTLSLWPRRFPSHPSELGVWVWLEVIESRVNGMGYREWRLPIGLLQRKLAEDSHD